MWGILSLYGAMVVAQSQGGAIISFLHGNEAAAKALADLASQDVQPDLDIDQLCMGYDAAHFDSSSNILHAAGMVSALWLFVYSTMLFLFGFGNFKHFLYIPPIYYLPAWVGHFVFQKDIPAVFTYGTTANGLLKGEICAFRDLFHGGMSRNSTELLYSVILIIAMIGSLMKFGDMVPKEERPPVSTHQREQKKSN